MDEKQKNIVINAIVAAGAILFMLIILEVYLQVTYHEPPARVFEYSQPIGWDNKANFRQESWSAYYRDDILQQHNSLRIRDEREFGPKEKPRIVILGDSFVYGTGLDQNDLIGRRLQEQLPNHEVITSGTIGYSTSQSIMSYEQKIRQLEPDIVIFALYINDFAENVMPIVFGYPKPWVHHLDPNASLFQQPQPQFNPVEEPPKKRPLLLTPGFVKRALPSKDGNTVYATSPYRNNQAWYLFETPLSQEQQYLILLQTEVLKLAKETVEADGAEFVVMYIPHQLQVDEEYRKTTLEVFEDKGLFTFYWFQPNGMVEDLQSQVGFTYLDPTLGFLQQKDSIADYYLPDGHLSPLGTALLDEQLYQFLTEEGLIEGTA